MKAESSLLSARLRSNQHVLSRKQVVAGFDGFIDSIQKVIFQTNAERQSEYFETVQSFGSYIASKGTGGLSLETEELLKKLGGNVPIMSNAIASLGGRAHCIGAFGYPAPDAVFLEMHPNTTLHSFTEPGITSALEFHDGKIMLAHMTQLNNADWELVKQRIGLENIIRMVQESDMLALLNWSETRHAGEIWSGLLEEVLPNVNRSLKAFFDLSDCSKYSSSKILGALTLIREFSRFCDVTLSLNRNEALLVCRAIGSEPGEDLLKAGKIIFEFMQIGTVVIHTAESSYAWQNSLSAKSAAFNIEHPAISTGAGDNFNAGYCTASLMDMDINESLILANAAAACYMKNGKSASIEELAAFLEGYGL
ncbi:carbohydrate kinase family protein [Flavihumibacter sp. R14]|nr:carbohydrate kinase family protein [Flavihumibacter soli]